MFLGDSLTDNGNLYHTLLKMLPKSPPYYKGRFSNGFTWAELVGDAYYKKYYADYHIYAVGGATAILHSSSTDNFMSPATLEGELLSYLSNSLFLDKSHTLFSIWIGANDYLFDKEVNIDKLTSKVVKKISWAIETLIKEHAQYFLILNLPNLSQIPMVLNFVSPERLQDISTLHNEKLKGAISLLKNKYPKVTIIFLDVHDTLSDLMNNPDKYNTKYETHITDTTHACWKGSLYLKNSKEIAVKSLANEFKKTYFEEHHQIDKNFDATALANYIINSPDLSEAYGVAKAYQNHEIPCENAEQYIFWDQLHPTAGMHHLLSQIVLESLEEVLANK